MTQVCTGIGQNLLFFFLIKAIKAHILDKSRIPTEKGCYPSGIIMLPVVVVVVFVIFSFNMLKVLLPKSYLRAKQLFKGK